MKNKRFILYLTLGIILFEAMIFFSITSVKSDEAIPEEYYQDFNLNGTYVYNILSRRTKTPSEVIPYDETSQAYVNYQVKLIETRKAILQEFIEIKELFEKRRKT